MEIIHGTIRESEEEKGKQSVGFSDFHYKFGRKNENRVKDYTTRGSV